MLSGPPIGVFNSNNSLLKSIRQIILETHRPTMEVVYFSVCIIYAVYGW